MTDLNALIERAVKEAAWLFCSQLRGAGVQDAYQLADVFETSLRQAPSIEALRTLAERQPVGDGEVEPTELERLRHENDCLQHRIAQLDYPCSPHCDGYLREMKLRREMEAAEQRGADRAFPRLTRAMIEAAAKAHYDTAGCEHINPDGIAMTANGKDYSFTQFMKRIWPAMKAAAIRQRIGGQ